MIVPYMNLPGMAIHDFKLKHNVAKQVKWKIERKKCSILDTDCFQVDADTKINFILLISIVEKPLYWSGHRTEFTISVVFDDVLERVDWILISPLIQTFLKLVTNYWIHDSLVNNLELYYS